MRPTPSRTELTPIVSYNPRDLALIRRTVASDTTDDEFALFIHWARSLRLDPLRRQVHAFVFHKQDPKKRRLSLVTSIEGFRAIAARSGNYRPDENEPSFMVDDSLKADINPAGLVSCAVRVWQYAHGQWFPITGVARWEEFAPLKTISRPSARFSTNPAAGGTCPSSCSPNAPKHKPSGRAGRRTSATLLSAKRSSKRRSP
jgi:phage recombination protein Bet